MKSRRESTAALVKQIRKAAKARGVPFGLLRSQGDHEVYSLDGLRLPIPHGRWLKSGTAASIRKDAAVKLGANWWR